MQFHTYVLCAFLSVSYTSIKKLIKALKKIEYVKYMCYLKFSRNVNSNHFIILKNKLFDTLM